MLKRKSVLILTGTLFIAFSCNRGPKVIESSAKNEQPKNNTGIFSEEAIAPIGLSNNTSVNEDLHTVVVNEVLPTSKYVYLKVTENKEEFWIATRKKEIIVGETYYYKGGLLKTNFESREHNRIFDKIYLISNLVASDHSHHADHDNHDHSNTTTEKVDIPTHTEKLTEHKGTIKIAELIKNPNQYQGKSIQVSGKCVKVNSNIMGKNWIHIKDGSKDDYDLVITSNAVVQEGSVITMKAIVVLNKDFGAGYKYDLILENGTIVP